MPKKATSFRIAPDANLLLEEMSRRFSTAKGQLVNDAIRELARKRKVELPKSSK
jgi:predicted DNA-binding protein